MTRRPSLLLVALSLLAAPAARAAQYEVDINIEDERDLYALAESDQISSETLETLVELFRDGVDLNTASRDELYALPNVTYEQVDAILEYRRLAGRIQDPADLVVSGALPQETLEQIAPFLVLEEARERPPISGHLRSVTRYSIEDPTGPPTLLQGQLAFPLNLSFGFAAMTTRLRLGTVSYDAGRDALRAPAPSYGIEIPKYYLRWRSSQRQVIAGTFRAGFGERLTLDNTSRYTPNGFYGDRVTFESVEKLTRACREVGAEADEPCEELVDEDLRMTPDFRWRDTFRGLAGSVENLSLVGDTRASFFAFASYQSRSAYQYSVYDFGRCEDPRSDAAVCRAPAVYVQDGASTSPNRWAYSTLPGVFNEATGGGHVTLHLGDLTQLGVTGYASNPTSAVEGVRLDFQEWSPYPFQGPFGAIGVDGSTRFGPVNASFEVSRAFHSEPGAGGGGFAAVQRNTIAVAKKQELEVLLRYYDKNFANPWARPTSADDQFEGNRARNEAGARVRYLAKALGDFRLRGTADFWLWPSDGAEPNTAGFSNLRLDARADFTGWDFLKLSGWSTYTNKDLKRNGVGHCYGFGTDDLASDPGFLESIDLGGPATSGDVVIDELTGEPAPNICSGERFLIAARATARPFRDLVEIWVQPTESFLSNPREDRTLWVGVRTHPVTGWYFDGRVRFRDQDVADPARGEATWWAIVRAEWRPSRLISTALRYDAYAYVDQRESTPDRRPNPEHRFRLELATRF